METGPAPFAKRRPLTFRPLRTAVNTIAFPYPLAIG